MYGLLQAFAPSAVVVAAGAQMTVEVPAAQEFGEGELGEDVGPQIAVGAGPLHRGEQPGREGQPAEAQAGGERFARRAAVDDAVGGEALEGQGAGALLQPQVAVVVVLDHPGAGVARPADQGLAACR